MDTKSTAPTIAFAKGDTSADMLPHGYFYSIDSVELVEPFKSLWDKTAYLITPEVPMKGYAWDRRRGWFKGLVYWYFLNDAAGRGGILRFPTTMRGYVSQALQALGRHGRTAQQNSAMCHGGCHGRCGSGSYAGTTGCTCRPADGGREGIRRRERYAPGRKATGGASELGRRRRGEDERADCYAREEVERAPERDHE
jgi:hypothetical protein